MANQKEITLRQGEVSPKDIVLHDLPVADLQAQTTIYLSEFDATPKNVVLRDPTVQPQSAGPITITGDLAATDGSDTAAFVGDVAHVGTLAATDGADTAVLSGKLGHVGILSATDGADTCVATGTVSGSVEGVYPGSGHPAGGSRISTHGLLKKRAKPFDTDLAEQMREAYDEILGIAKPQVKKQAAKIVRPFIEQGVKPITIPPARIIDWQAMERDAERVSALLELWQNEMQAMEDEEILLLLMAA